VKKLVPHVLITLFLAAVALSQEGYSKGNPAAGPLSGPFPDRPITLSLKSDDGSGSGRSGGGFIGNAAAGVRGLLPSTGGGAALAVLGVGVVLILGGLTVRRVFR
jgi:hypothetical protein